MTPSVTAILKARRYRLETSHSTMVTDSAIKIEIASLLEGVRIISYRILGSKMKLLIAEGA